MIAIGTCKILLPMRYCSLQDIAPLLLARYCSLAPCEILLPARNGYLRDIGSDAIWLLVRYACLQNINYTRMPFQVIGNIDSQRNMTAYGYQLPIQLYCQIARYTEILLLVEYCCQRHNSEILVPWDICTCYINYNRMPISRDLPYLTILTAWVSGRDSGMAKFCAF